MITLSYLEFYSGIGGWGYALEHACRSIQHATLAMMMDQRCRHQKKPKLLSASINKESASLHPFHIDAKLLAAYDHSDLCNSVFMHNHASYTEPAQSSNEPSQYKPRQTPIERITKEELESHSANIWCMSPPCQPHTRQHSNQHKEMDDPRSSSFLHLCHLLSVMDEDALPGLILLENVVGFETSWEGRSLGADTAVAASDLTPSDSHDKSSRTLQTQKGSTSRGSFAEWRRVLSQRQYDVAHFHLDPTNVGIPNNRPRYYCVAFRLGGLRQRLNNAGVPNYVSRSMLDTAKLKNLFTREILDKQPIIHDESSIHNNDANNSDNSKRHEKTAIPPIKCFLDADLMQPNDSSSRHLTKKLSLQIPRKVQMSSSSWCFDIVTPYHKCSSCFTHSYGKYIRGTGSILYTGPLRLNDENEDGKMDKSVPSIDRFQLALPEERSYDESWSKDINWDYMRYLSGTEIARLMGFPVSEPAAEQIQVPCNKSKDDDVVIRKFSFPPSCSMKQQWKLLGNSLNVRVAARIAEIGIQAVLNDLIED
ncbi:hypothetical protein HJC23_004249 [Cyclotella cryptica]|uniref:S-adenosyl-L-methionine-dependent methyltransferase n=1 Tax=Cyclotella cryptica TaxID=29204 RepID=A0ABD3Q7V2_9STRA|eukprot:CCRYP_007899-RA/>CCRYP_007899-RA protein AED:0.00 eAED:0.00 QI:135/-1/1/1/-1/1/1/387/535